MTRSKDCGEDGRLCFHLRFMPVAGKYMCNILNGKSNGAQKNMAWGWKDNEVLRNSQPKELGHVPWSAQRPELQSFEGGSWSSKL